MAVMSPAVWERFRSHIRIGKRGCWLWQGRKTTPNSHGKGGYGRFNIHDKDVSAHRYAYEHFKGPIPAGYTIDHTCRRHNCVNPDHLVTKTHRDNILAGRGRAAKNAKKKRCLRGHWYTAANTGIQKNGRFCKQCRRAAYRRYHARQRELKAA